MPGRAVSACRSIRATPPRRDWREELRQLVQHSRLAGLVLAPPMSEQPELIRTLIEAKIPLMRIISARQDPQDGYPCVYVDDRDAAYAITEHLIQLGHQRIGFLWGGKEHRSSIERYQGYEDALKGLRHRFGPKAHPAGRLHLR